jgi:hypothetical protein
MLLVMDRMLLLWKKRSDDVVVRIVVARVLGITTTSK